MPFPAQAKQVWVYKQDLKPTFQKKLEPDNMNTNTKDTKLMFSDVNNILHLSTLFSGNTS